MTSASSSHSFVQLTSSEEGNWLSLGRALTTVLCKGLRPFVKRETEALYNNVKAIPPGACTCVYVPRRRPNQYHDMNTCAWANILQGYHHGNKPNWKQSDPTKWMDPNVGPWEIAKLFLPDIGGHTVIQSADDMEISAILNLMFWCTHFTVQRPLIKDVRDTRNTKWAHVPKLELTEAEKKDAFETIEKLLQDPALARDVDAQEALREILALKCTSDVHIFKAEVLSHFKEAIQNEVNSLKRESKRNKKQRSRVDGQLRNLQRALENVEKKQKASISVPLLIITRMVYVVSCLVKSARGIRRRSLVMLLMFLILCCSVEVLDHRSYRDGCPAEDISVPFDSKEFNLTEYLTIARENFIGRRWLYQEIENALDPALRLSGVLIIGDPGAGKSALSAQLVCSRTSSRTIHDHVLGYHLCKHSDKNTQIAGKFVRNLAEMIARRLPEYGNIVSNSSYIQRSLNTDCVTIEDPVGCFEQTILLPLRSLTNVPKENWYVVLDALDECLTQSESSHSIVYLLNNKLPRFPSWLKLVMTSRNESSVSLTSDSIKKLVIDPEDSRNIEDIELFLSTKFYQQDGPLLQRVKDWFGGNSLENTAKLISALLSKSQGNFLFVKEMLHHWETSRVARSDPYALPGTLGDLYHSYFQRLYDRREQFRPVRRVLELLVSTFQPLTQKEIFEVLRMKEPNLDEDYDFKDRMKELGHFLRYGENDTITLYHLSLTEWLTSDNSKNGPFYVSKKKGHEVFCDFFFRLIADGGKSALSRYILILAQHIAHGGWKEAYVKEFLKFPSQVVNSSDPESNRTLLHLAATINSTDVLELLLRHFSCIDCTDNRGITPAFLAAEHGLVENLALMVRRGAKINRKTKSLKFKFKYKSTSGYLSTAVFESKSKFWGSTMLHAAAYGGHLDVVTFLLDNGAFVSTVNVVHLTALQIAAENGHFRVVKALYEAGAVADQTALNHAAANNRLEVVKYLLQIGVKDNCMRCDGSFYWLKKEKYRYQSKPAVSTTTIPKKEHRRRGAEINGQTLTYDHESHFERGVISKTLNVIGELFDDRHLIACETALHTAISLGHKEIVIELVLKDKLALACHDYTGRTPLHEAVRKNNTEMVKLLLREDETKLHSSCDHWQDVQGQHDTGASLTLSHEEYMEYHQDICHCGYTPLHLAARYGYWRMAIHLVVNGANVGARDCFGATPLHVAACHNHWLMVYLLSTKYGSDINGKTFNGSTPLHSAATCGAVEVIDHLLDYGANPSVTDDTRLTALHYAILNIHSNQLERDLDETRSGDSPRLPSNNRTCHLAGFFVEENYVKNTNHYLWLDMLLHLIISGFAIDAADKYGRTALHIAAGNGLADAVNVLLQKNANLEICDKFEKTPLEVAVENATAVTKHSIPLTWLGKSSDQLKPHLRDHEMVVSLLLSAGVSFKKCSDQPGESLLHRAIVNKQPRIAYLLLLNGASLNRNCDDDSCLDTEGFTPLHRASQGANVAEVQRLIKQGADVSLLSPQGHDALTLAILHAGGSIWQDPKDLLGMDKVSDVAIELLRHKMKTRGFRIVCDSSKVELTLYHLAASRGLVKFIKQIYKDKNLHKLNVDCPNRDGITPLYLAKMFGKQVKTHIYNPWEVVVRIIENEGGRLRHPSRGAEYTAVYNRLYGWNPNDFQFNLKTDVRVFFIGLLSSYGYWQTNQASVAPCQPYSRLNMTRMEMGSPFSTIYITIELSRQLMLFNQSQNSTMVSFAQKEIDNCAKEMKKFHSLFDAFSDSLYSRREPERGLFNLMEMWHMSYEHFLCLKMWFNKYKQYFLDETTSKQLIEQYENSTPVWYFNEVCLAFEQAVKSQIPLYRDIEFRILYHDYPDFINGRMGWSVDQGFIGGLSGFSGSWPFEFLIKFSLGFYRQYDYLKVLNVGIESKTHISLYLDKMDEIYCSQQERNYHRNFSVSDLS